ncbi:hypothetical protein MIDIC_10067 [Alphaproteobacteria bacterium]
MSIIIFKIIYHMEYSSYLGLAFLEQYQLQKEILLNQNFFDLDNILSGGIISCSVTAPPTQNVICGDKYIIPGNAKSEWQNQIGRIALFSGKWKYITPKEGAVFWVIDVHTLIVYDRNQWRDLLTTR